MHAAAMAGCGLSDDDGLTSHNAGHYATCSLPRPSTRHQHSLCRFSIVALIQPLRLSPILGRARWPLDDSGTARDADSQNAPSHVRCLHFCFARVACLYADSSPRVVGAYACACRTLRTSSAPFRRHVPANSRTLTAELHEHQSRRFMFATSTCAMTRRCWTVPTCPDDGNAARSPCRVSFIPLHP